MDTNLLVVLLVAYKASAEKLQDMYANENVAKAYALGRVSAFRDILESIAELSK